MIRKGWCKEWNAAQHFNKSIYIKMFKAYMHLYALFWNLPNQLHVISALCTTAFLWIRRPCLSFPSPHGWLFQCHWHLISNNAHFLHRGIEGSSVESECRYRLVAPLIQCFRCQLCRDPLEPGSSRRHHNRKAFHSGLKPRLWQQWFRTIPVDSDRWKRDHQFEWSPQSKVIKRCLGLYIYIYNIQYI